MQDRIDATISGMSSNMDDIDTILESKVDKVEGKALSANDFTSEEKEKLASLSNYDDSEILESLETKVDKVEGKSLSTNDYTNEDKTKLTDLVEIKSIGKNLTLDEDGELSADGGTIIHIGGEFTQSLAPTQWTPTSEFNIREARASNEYGEWNIFVNSSSVMPSVEKAFDGDDNTNVQIIENTQKYLEITFPEDWVIKPTNIRLKADCIGMLQGYNISNNQWESIVETNITLTTSSVYDLVIQKNDFYSKIRLLVEGYYPDDPFGLGMVTYQYPSVYEFQITSGTIQKNAPTDEIKLAPNLINNMDIATKQYVDTAVGSATGGTSGGEITNDEDTSVPIYKVWVGTIEEYEALEVIDPNTEYNIIEE